MWPTGAQKQGRPAESDGGTGFYVVRRHRLGAALLDSKARRVIDRYTTRPQNAAPALRNGLAYICTLLDAAVTRRQSLRRSRRTS